MSVCITFLFIKGQESSRKVTLIIKCQISLWIFITKISRLEKLNDLMRVLRIFWVRMDKSVDLQVGEVAMAIHRVARLMGLSDGLTQAVTPVLSLCPALISPKVSHQLTAEAGLFFFKGSLEKYSQMHSSHLMGLFGAGCLCLLVVYNKCLRLLLDQFPVFKIVWCSKLFWAEHSHSEWSIVQRLWVWVTPMRKPQYQ